MSLFSFIHLTLELALFLRYIFIDFDTSVIAFSLQLAATAMVWVLLLYRILLEVILRFLEKLFAHFTRLRGRLNSHSTALLALQRICIMFDLRGCRNVCHSDSGDSVLILVSWYHCLER